MRRIVIRRSESGCSTTQHMGLFTKPSTLYHVLKRYPIVLFILTLLGIFLLKKMSDPLLALALQVIIFGLAHFRGAELLNIIDMFSVMLIAFIFTYYAYKTGLLIAGIVFHFIHNAFLSLIQVPESIYTGF